MRKNSGIEDDRKFIESVICKLNLDTSEQEFIEHYMLYAEYQTHLSKRLYYAATCLTVICPILVMVVEQIDPRPMEWPDYLVLLLTVGSTISASALSVFRFHERWIHFRTYFEKGIELLSTPSLTLVETEVNGNNRHVHLINAFHKLNGQEHTQWLHLSRSQKRGGNDSMSE